MEIYYHAFKTQDSRYSLWTFISFIVTSVPMIYRWVNDQPLIATWE